MNIAHLLQRIRLGEDSTLELKRIRVADNGKHIEPHADGLSDELAALGNARPVIHAQHQPAPTREITGIPLEHLDRVEDWLTAICRDRIPDGPPWLRGRNDPAGERQALRQAAPL